MKIFLALLLVGFAGFLAATDFPPSLAGNTKAVTLLTATTNATSSSLDIEKEVYHTFQMNYTSTGNSTNTLSYSLDGTNWVNFYTNELTAAAIKVTTLTGKFRYARSVYSASNGTVAVLYLGQ